VRDYLTSQGFIGIGGGRFFINGVDTETKGVDVVINWSFDNLSATLKATRYGEVLTPGTTAATDFILTPKTLVDLEARYEFNDNRTLAFGADNIFDQYPDAFPINLNTTGATSFSNYSPFGRSGRLFYGRVAYNF
jgi:iron complex outermembrane receptor protein